MHEGALTRGVILYSLTMSLASLMFWKADFLFTWLVLDGISLPMLSAASVLAVAGLAVTSLVFRAGLRRYASASS